MEQSVRAGAQDRLHLDGVQIQSFISARARLDALARAQKALGDLEDPSNARLHPAMSFR